MLKKSKKDKAQHIQRKTMIDSIIQKFEKFSDGSEGLRATYQYLWQDFDLSDKDILYILKKVQINKKIFSLICDSWFYGVNKEGNDSVFSIMDMAPLPGVLVRAKNIVVINKKDFQSLCRAADDKDLSEELIEFKNDFLEKHN